MGGVSERLSFFDSLVDVLLLLRRNRDLLLLGAGVGSTVGLLVLLLLLLLLIEGGHAEHLVRLVHDVPTLGVDHGFHVVLWWVDGNHKTFVALTL
jgi:hypothetical protein